jgi:hypothetical protein
VKNTFDQRVLDYIKANPGCTAKELTIHFPVESKTYGRQRAINSAIARLRAAGCVQDVQNRCSQCRAALTRGIPNQPIYAAPTTMCASVALSAAA